jgi:hypothetical protein
MRLSIHCQEERSTLWLDRYIAPQTSVISTHAAKLDSSLTGDPEMQLQHLIAFTILPDTSQHII